jgi:hypothetical protein
MEGEEAPPLLVGASPHSHPVPDPKNAIPVDVAMFISSGKLVPEDFLRRKEVALGIKQVATDVSAAAAG